MREVPGCILDHPEFLSMRRELTGHTQLPHNALRLFSRLEDETVQTAVVTADRKTNGRRSLQISDNVVADLQIGVI